MKLKTNSDDFAILENMLLVLQRLEFCAYNHYTVHSTHDPSYIMVNTHRISNPKLFPTYAFPAAFMLPMGYIRPL